MDNLSLIKRAIILSCKRLEVRQLINIQVDILELCKKSLTFRTHNITGIEDFISSLRMKLYEIEYLGLRNLLKSLLSEFKHYSDETGYYFSESEMKQGYVELQHKTNPFEYILNLNTGEIVKREAIDLTTLKSVLSSEYIKKTMMLKSTIIKNTKHGKS